VFEHFSEPLLPKAEFRRRQARHIAWGLYWIAVALTVGALGYQNWFPATSKIDSYQAAAMILSGMGPEEHPETTGGKIFATVYALLSGLFYPAVLGFMVAPRVHRSLHRYQLKKENQEEGRSSGTRTLP
jgi:hypothetical protein